MVFLYPILESNSLGNMDKYYKLSGSHWSKTYCFYDVSVLVPETLPHFEYYAMQKSSERFIISDESKILINIHYVGFKF